MLGGLFLHGYLAAQPTQSETGSNFWLGGFVSITVRVTIKSKKVVSEKWKKEDVGEWFLI
jgi:hypothetical protein